MSVGCAGQLTWSPFRLMHVFFPIVKTQLHFKDSNRYLPYVSSWFIFMSGLTIFPVTTNKNTEFNSKLLFSSYFNTWVTPSIVPINQVLLGDVGGRT